MHARSTSRRGASCCALHPVLELQARATHALPGIAARRHCRGLRAASDFEYEFMMASMNKEINSSVETLFMMTAQNLYFVSSTMIKELFHYGGDVSAYVPPAVQNHLKQKIPLRKK